MDKKTRTLNALTGKPVDRPPMLFWTNFTGEQAAGKACAQACLDFYRRSGEDFVKVPFDGFFGIPGVEIKTMREWRDFKVPKMTDAYAVDQFERLKMVLDLIGGETCVFQNTLNPSFLLRKACGAPLLDASLRAGDPDFMAVYDATTDFLAELAVRLIETGAQGCYICLQNGEKARFTEEEYARLLRPYDMRIIEACNRASDTNILHLCGWTGEENNLAFWRDYPAAIIHWDVHTDHLSLKEGRDFFPNKRGIMGGFNNKPGSLIYTGNKEEITRAVIEDVESAGKDNLIISSDCSLMGETPFEHLRWVGEALDSIAQQV